MGITTPLRRVPAAVLGANDVQPLEMASAYATLANRGVHVDPVFVTSIARADGTILYEAEHHQQRVLDADVADQVTSVLEQVVQRGHGHCGPDRPPGRRQDRHGAGVAQRLVLRLRARSWPTAVWVGYAGGEQLSMMPPRTAIRVTGGSYPARIWRRFMDAATDGTRAAPLRRATTAAVAAVDHHRCCLPPPRRRRYSVPASRCPVGRRRRTPPRPAATLQALGFRVTRGAARRTASVRRSAPCSPSRPQAGHIAGTAGSTVSDRGRHGRASPVGHPRHRRRRRRRPPRRDDRPPRLPPPPTAGPRPASPSLGGRSDKPWSTSAPKLQIVVLVVDHRSSGGRSSAGHGSSATTPRPARPARRRVRSPPPPSRSARRPTVEIEALGLPTEVDDAAERAELVDNENDILRAMLDELGDLDRPGGEEGEWVASGSATGARTSTTGSAGPTTSGPATTTPSSRPPAAASRSRRWSTTSPRPTTWPVPRVDVDRRTDVVSPAASASACPLDTWGSPGRPPAPGVLRPGAQADPGSELPWAGAAGAVPSSTSVRPRSPVTRSAPSKAAVDAEGLAELRRAVGQVEGTLPTGRAAPHQLEPVDGRQAARSSTAVPSPSSPQTALAHQCMP